MEKQKEKKEFGFIGQDRGMIEKEEELVNLEPLSDIYWKI